VKSRGEEERMGDEKAMKKGKEDREGKRKMRRGDTMLLAAYQTYYCLLNHQPASTKPPQHPPHHLSTHPSLGAA
jgi:hypothetical protein